MKVLLDTNLLTRMAEPGYVQHQPALDSTDLVGTQGHDLLLVPQILYEFWFVCTRPLGLNGLGRSAAEAESELAKFKSLFAILDESPLILPEWEKLVTSLQVIGKNAHDCRLVAAMTIHNVSHLLTFNEQDFRRYPGIRGSR
jgi:predicted nucleic acid-binding protein